MRLWHTAAATSAQFDDLNLVSHAGLVPVMRWPWYDAWDGLFNATHRTTHRAPPARVA